MAKRKICIVTGTRAEYGLLYWLMKEIQGDPGLELQIIATGMHLSPEFGLTYKKIEEDRNRLFKKVIESPKDSQKKVWENIENEIISP